MDQVLPLIFGGIAIAGTLYFVVSLLFGGDHSILEALHIDFLDSIQGDDGGFGCIVIAAFAAIFGAMGLLGTLSDWNLIITLVAALAIGVLAARGTLLVLRFVLKQQSPGVQSVDLIGISARVTINTPAGKMGEVMVEQDEIKKYPAKSEDGSAMQRGEIVLITANHGGILTVARRQVS